MEDDRSRICAVDSSTPQALVPLAEYETLRQKAKIFSRCLFDIARLMNEMADRLEALNTSLSDETRPAPLGD